MSNDITSEEDEVDEQEWLKAYFSVTSQTPSAPEGAPATESPAALPAALPAAPPGEEAGGEAGEASGEEAGEEVSEEAGKEVEIGEGQVGELSEAEDNTGGKLPEQTLFEDQLRTAQHMLDQYKQGSPEAGEAAIYHDRIETACEAAGSETVAAFRQAEKELAEVERSVINLLREPPPAAAEEGAAGEAASEAGVMGEEQVETAGEPALADVRVTPESDAEVARPPADPAVDALRESARETEELVSAVDSIVEMETLEMSGTSLEENFLNRWATAKLQWQQASSTVAVQMSQLQFAMRKADDPAVREAADFELMQIATGNFKTPLMTAIYEVDRTEGQARYKAAQNALAIVASLQKHISAEAAVKDCEVNPWGVQVTIQETLGKALRSLEQALQLAQV